MADPGETNQEAADRGFTAGQIDARLAGHDRRLADLNGNIARLGDEVHDLVLETHRLADQATAGVKTATATAAALKAADDARRSQFQRMVALVTALAAVVGILVAVGALR